MSSSRRVAGVLLLLVPIVPFGMLADDPAASASQIIINGDSCTVVHTPAEHEDVLALTGVFAANWSAEILRDIPTAAEDLATARSWHADKTSAALNDMPDHVREAVDRINRAGQRVGYREDEATAPLRLLVERNDRRGTGRTWQTYRLDEARQHVDTTRRTGAPALLSGTREDLSVPAGESWQRSWDRTPGARAEADASGAELRLCSRQTSGTVNRTTGKAKTDANLSIPSLPAGIPAGRIHTTTVLELLNEISAFSC